MVNFTLFQTRGLFAGLSDFGWHSLGAGYPQPAQTVRKPQDEAPASVADVLNSTQAMLSFGHCYGWIYINTDMYTFSLGHS